MPVVPPPTKTTAEDINVVAGFLKSQIGWTSLSDVRKRLPSKHTGSRKIEAMRYLGLLDRDGENVKLTDDGRAYADGGHDEQTQVMAKRMRAIPLYHASIEWMHYTHKKDEASKTDVANHWHDNLSDESGGVTGDSLADAVVFFLRMAEVAGIGKFVAAGIGRDTHLDIDREQLERFVAEGAGSRQQPKAEPKPDKPEPPAPPPPAPPTSTKVDVEPGLQVNVEIHIAADAKPTTIEEIFKNMRKYLLGKQELADDS